MHFKMRNDTIGSSGGKTLLQVLLEISQSNFVAIKMSEIF